MRRVVALSAANVDDRYPDRQPSRFRGRPESGGGAGGHGQWPGLGGAAADHVRGERAFGLWAEQIRRGDAVYGSYAEATWSPIHELDLAEVAVRALLDDDLLGTRPVLTGPESPPKGKWCGPSATRSAASSATSR
ncbi:hypothetical protein [Kutzneria kofuensis]|uniref:hypothetical protein n=1 Tax=Kutzneria kofuensis TaxID=103725 RepID=UPI0031E718F2